MAIGDACEDNCADGLWCDFSSGGTCAAKISDAMTCHGNASCTSGSCDATTKVCVDPALRCNGR